MKTRRFILLELAALGGVSGVLLVAGDHFGTASAWEASAPVSAPHREAQRSPFEPPQVAVTHTPAGTFTGIQDELLLAPLRTQDVRDVKFNHGGSSISLRVTFADGSRAAFKPLQTNPQTVPRKEIAAYWLNRLLGLNNVPPACGRTLHRDELIGKLTPESRSFIGRINSESIFDKEGFTRGEVSYWIPVVLNSKLDAPEEMAVWTGWLTVGNELPRDQLSLMEQLSSLLVFDLLENNSDRFSGNNMLTSTDGKILYYMDNTFGFQLEPQGHQRCREALSRCQKFSRRLVDALRRFDGHALRSALELDQGVLTDDEIGGVVARRNVALRYIDNLISRFGEERVLVFP